MFSEGVTVFSRMRLRSGKRNIFLHSSNYWFFWFFWFSSRFFATLIGFIGFLGVLAMFSAGVTVFSRMRPILEQLLSSRDLLLVPKNSKTDFYVPNIFWEGLKTRKNIGLGGAIYPPNF